MHDDQRLDATNFAGFVKILRQRVWVLAVCLVVVPLVALAYTSQQDKEYTAVSKVLLKAPDFEENLSGLNSPTPGATGAGVDVVTTLDVAALSTVASKTARALGPVYTGGAIAGMIKLTTDGESNLVSINATSTSPTLARRVADAYATQYIVFRRALDRSRIAAARVRIQAELRRAHRNTRVQGAKIDVQRRHIAHQIDALSQTNGGRGEILNQRLDDLRGQRQALRDAEDQLRQRDNDLGTLSALQTGNAELVQHAFTPSSPVSPKPVRNLIAGIGLGLLLGIALAVVFELLDRRLRSPRDVETLFDRPIVGAIPRSIALAGKGGDALRLPAVDKESFRMLQANMRYFNADQPLESVLVTSAAPGDGKSTVSWNVAVAAAELGSKVLLIEADLRHPTFVKRFGMTVETGLSDILTGRAELADVARQVPVGSRRSSRSHHANGNGNGAASDAYSMDVVFAGRLPANPRGLIASERMTALIREAEERYDFVVIDTPPTSIVSDAIPLVGRVSGVLVVTRLRKNTRDAAEHLRDQLQHLNANTIGIVVNSIEDQDGYYGSVYGYAREYEAAGN